MGHNVLEESSDLDHLFSEDLYRARGAVDDTLNDSIFSNSFVFDHVALYDNTDPTLP